MALQGQVRPRIDEIFKKIYVFKKKIQPFNIDNLRNGVNTVISEIIMKQAGGSCVGSSSAEKDLGVLVQGLTPPSRVPAASRAA